MATTHIMYPISSPNRSEVVIEGTFKPDTASAPTISAGVGFSVARTSQGLFTITFDRKYPTIITKWKSLQLATAAARFLQFGSYSAANGTLQLRVVDAAGGVQDIAADANNLISFGAVFKLSGV